MLRRSLRKAKAVLTVGSDVDSSWRTVWVDVAECGDGAFGYDPIVTWNGKQFIVGSGSNTIDYCPEMMEDRQKSDKRKSSRRKLYDF